jgi:hypothetical protein
MDVLLCALACATGLKRPVIALRPILRVGMFSPFPGLDARHFQA